MPIFDVKNKFKNNGIGFVKGLHFKMDKSNSMGARVEFLIYFPCGFLSRDIGDNMSSQHPPLLNSHRCFYQDGLN